MDFRLPMEEVKHYLYFIHFVLYQNCAFTNLTGIKANNKTQELII
jgi:hypothetical protein